jgi:hypothetical protein
MDGWMVLYHVQQALALAAVVYQDEEAIDYFMQGCPDTYRCCHCRSFGVCLAACTYCHHQCMLLNCTASIDLM